MGKCVIRLRAIGAECSPQKLLGTHERGEGDVGGRGET